MESQRQLYDYGRPPERLNISNSLEENECTTWKQLKLSLDSFLMEDNPTSMLELAAPSNEVISSDKFKISKKRSLDTSSSKTSPLASTLNAKGYRGFWNLSSPGWSKKLPLPIETDLRDLDATCWSSSSKNLALNSWFLVKMKTTNMISPVTSLLLPQCSLHPITDAVQQKIERDEEKKKTQAENAKRKREEKKLKLETTLPKKKKNYENPVRARRVRIFPDKEQKKGLDQLFGTVRFCYNTLVSSNRVVGVGGVNLATLRKTIKEAHEVHPWMKEMPGEIKDVAVCDYEKARKAHFAKLENKREKDPKATHDAQFKFRSRKDPQESFEVRWRDMNRKKGKLAFLSLEKLQAAEGLPKTVECAVRFLKDRLGRYFVAVPKQSVKKGENQAFNTSESVVSLDPGVRTFQTTYDAIGLSTEWGKNDMKKMYIFCRRIDKIQGEMSKKKGRKRRGTKQRWYRMIDKVKHKIKEIHRKLAIWLCENYSVILIPNFESSKMVNRGTRKINSMTARNMLTWSHYGFRELLKNKAELYEGVRVEVTEEPYTSKTCGQCGKLHETLGGSKVFKCKHCGYLADRDVNGARNILLRYLSLYCEVSGKPDSAA